MVSSLRRERSRERGREEREREREDFVRQQHTNLSLATHTTPRSTPEVVDTRVSPSSEKGSARPGMGLGVCKTSANCCASTTQAVRLLRRIPRIPSLFGPKLL
jgi:hypothetical protein